MLVSLHRMEFDCAMLEMSLLFGVMFEDRA